MSEPLIELRGVCVSFDARLVLSNLSVCVQQGRHTLVSGSSGSGKTTLLRVMALLEAVDQGQVFYRTTDVTGLGYHPEIGQRLAALRIGLVSQTLDLWPHLTVERNISLSILLQGRSQSHAKQLAERALLSLGIAEHGEKYPAELSGGERQRAAIARSIVHQPSVLLLDEITANLDAPNAQRVFKALIAVADQGTTIVMVSHQSNMPTDLFSNHLQLTKLVNGD